MEGFRLTYSVETVFRDASCDIEISLERVLGNNSINATMENGYRHTSMHNRFRSRAVP